MCKEVLIIWHLCGTEVAQTMYLVCIQCGTRNGKVISFIELALNAFFPNSNNASQSWPTVQLAVPLCACTGLLVQHSLTVITINSSITLCIVGADRMLTDVYVISCQLSTVHIGTVWYQNNKPIPHLTHFITTNNNSVQHPSVLNTTER